MRLRLLAWLVVGVLGCAACSNRSDGGAGGSGGGGGTAGSGGGDTGFDCSGADVPYAAAEKVFEGSCAGGEICHGGGLAQKFELRDWIGASSECAGEEIVKPGDPARSYLIHKVTGVGMCSGARMPKGGAPLPREDIQKLVDWICKDAPVGRAGVEPG